MLLDALIRLGSKRDYSHVYVKIVDPISGRELTFEASLGIVHFGTYEALKQSNIVVKEYKIDMDGSQLLKVWNFMLDRLEVSYGNLELILAAIKTITGIKLLAGDGEQTEICSELGARVCECLGIDIPGNLDYITPAELDDFLSTKLQRVA
jgi:hypothetical protein